MDIVLDKDGLSWGSNTGFSRANSTIISNETLVAKAIPSSTNEKRYAILKDVTEKPDVVLIGSIVMWSGSSAPTGWYLCDGTIKDLTTNPEFADLYNVIGNTFGPVSPVANKVYLPNFRGQAPIMTGSHTDVDGVLKTIGQGEEIGAYTHTLTQSQIPDHKHDSYVPSVTGIVQTTTDIGDTTVSTENGVTGHTGTTASHNNIQPSIGIYFIIRYL
jgi:microcystin-dependent protein